jgi:hypothetical protein
LISVEADKEELIEMMFLFKQLTDEATLTGAGLPSERSAEVINSRKKN